MPETARELPMSYVSDSKGQLVVDGEQKTTATPWKHYFVPSGTVVDVKCKEGAFQVLLDGKLMADWKISVPDEMDLYPLVSVYGTTQAIKLLPSDRDAKKGTSSSSSKAQVESASSTSEEKKEDKPMGWGIFFAYMGCGVATVSFLYYFYKARYSFHQTEILIVDALRRLPMYWPPSPHDGEINARTDAEGLPEDIKLAFCEWFVVTDLEEAKGVTRDDVLELMHELGYSDKAQPAKDFLFRGEGHIEEKRRLTCAALQEMIRKSHDVFSCNDYFKIR
eukprot:symbB.v1.2.021494.t1/scaffold1806.1/size131321/9